VVVLQTKEIRTEPVGQNLFMFGVVACLAIALLAA